MANNPTIALRVSEQLLGQIDSLIGDKLRTRSEVVLFLISKALGSDSTELNSRHQGASLDDLKQELLDSFKERFDQLKTEIKADIKSEFEEKINFLTDEFEDLKTEIRASGSGRKQAVLGKDQGAIAPAPTERPKKITRSTTPAEKQAHALDPPTDKPIPYSTFRRWAEWAETDTWSYEQHLLSLGWRKKGVGTSAKFRFEGKS